LEFDHNGKPRLLSKHSPKLFKDANFIFWGLMDKGFGPIRQR